MIQIVKGDVKSIREKVKKMRKAGMTFQEIADVLGVTRQRAHQIYKKAINK